MRSLVIAFALLLVVSALPRPVTAQEDMPAPDAFVTGTVVDQDGNPVIGANVGAHSDGYWLIMEQQHGQDSGGGDMPPPKEPAKDTIQGEEPDRPASGPAVATSRPAPYGGYNATTTGHDGSFGLGVYSGYVSLNVYKEGYAGVWHNVEMTPGQELSVKLEAVKYPAKTATVVIDAKAPDGARIPVHVSVEAPLYGMYECSQSDATAPSKGDLGVSEAADADGDGEADPARPSILPDEPYAGGCALQRQSDGTYTGKVTPGYTIIRISHDSWSSCDPTSSHCQERFLPYVRTMQLPAGQTTHIDVTLRAKPAPDATLQGYILDGSKGIPGAHISFQHQTAGAYGSANTDQDGSFKVALRSGPHEVYVWADGYLQWAGLVDVQAGTDRRDIQMTQGRSGCCNFPMPLAMEDKAAGDAGGLGPMAPTMAGDGDDMRSESGADQRDAAQGNAYQDLGGGLGPYDADAASQGPSAEAGHESPAPALIVLLGTLIAVTARRRK